MVTGDGTSGRYVERGGHTRIHYTTGGALSGPTIVFVHGWGCRRSDFAPLGAFLPDDLRTVAVDLAGHGDSRSTRDDWTIEEFADDVAAVLAAESVDRCTVVGHSLGGAVALELARLLPGVVENVVGLEAYHYLTLFPRIEESAIRALVSGLEADYPAAIRGFVAMGSRPGTDPAFDEEIAAKMASVPPDVGIAALRGLLRWDMDAVLPVLTQPVTEIAQRGLFDPAAVDRYGDRITFVVVDLGSHHFPLEQPERTARLLTNPPIGRGRPAAG